MSVEYSIAQVLPHEGRMLLLDELFEYGQEHVVAAVEIRPDSVLCEPGRGVPSWVGLEYMAQTVAAFSGVEEVRLGMKPRIGLLLGTRNYQAKVPYFPIGARLVVRGEMLIRGEDDLVAFACEIRCGDEQYAVGDVKAARPRDIHALVREQLRSGKTHG